MKSPKTLVFLTLFTAMALSSCSGTKTACTSNCTGSGNGSVSVTMVADTLPANPSILSLQVTIIGITFTSSAGTNQSVTLNPAITLDLMRLQSDTAFLGTFANIPSGQYTSATLAFSNPAKITFLNDTTATLSGCAVSAICPLTSNTAAGTPVATVSFAVPQSGVTGIGIDLNFANAVSISGGNLVVNFSNNNVLSGFTLPRANSNLASGQLELIEDFTGVVSISGSSVTITSPTRGVLTATSTSNSFFDQSPPPTNLCPSAPNNCAVAGQIASVDAFLKSDGALELKEFEPLNATQQDFVEGTVYAVNSPTQFTIAVTDKVQAATTSLISGLNTGDRLTVNIPALTQPFLVDSKGLAVQNSFGSSYSLFATQTTTSAVHAGQTVAVHVSAFTAASGTTLASANADTVILRWTRLRANVVSATSATVNIDTLPSYFGISASSQEVVQAFLNGALGADGVTNLDGVASNTSGLTTSQRVGLRVLYFQNPGNTANPAFFAAKIRQP